MRWLFKNTFEPPKKQIFLTGYRDVFQPCLWQQETGFFFNANRDLFLTVTKCFFVHIPDGCISNSVATTRDWKLKRELKVKPREMFQCIRVSHNANMYSSDGVVLSAVAGITSQLSQAALRRMDGCISSLADTWGELKVPVWAFQIFTPSSGAALLLTINCPFLCVFGSPTYNLDEIAPSP